MRLRYLTEAEKRRYLRQLAEAIKANDVDSEMIPWLARFNALQGVCTTQCCAGHKERGLDVGYISLRMAGRIRRLFESRCLGRLSRKSWFEDAETDYNFTSTGYVRPRVVLWFHAEQREQALADILEELQGLSARYVLAQKEESA